MRLDVATDLPIPDVKNSRGDTIGTVEGILRDQKGRIREVEVSLFTTAAPTHEALTDVSIDDIARVMWFAEINQEEALPVLQALKDNGIILRKVTDG